MIHQTSLLNDSAAAGEYDKVGNAANLEAGRELRVGFSIYLQNDCLASHVRRSAGDLRCGCATGAAPRSPEINQNRHRRVLYDVIKERSIHWKWFGQRRKRSFACSASSSTAEMFCGDAVLLVAMSARANDGHNRPRSALFDALKALKDTRCRHASSSRSGIFAHSATVNSATSGVSAESPPAYTLKRPGSTCQPCFSTL